MTDPTHKPNAPQGPRPPTTLADVVAAYDDAGIGDAVPASLRATEPDGPAFRGYNDPGHDTDWRCPFGHRAAEQGCDACALIVQVQRDGERAITGLIGNNAVAIDAFDEIAKLVGCPSWDYPGQLVRDVETMRTHLARCHDDLVLYHPAADVLEPAWKFLQGGPAHKANSEDMAEIVKLKIERDDTVRTLANYRQLYDDALDLVRERERERDAARLSVGDQRIENSKAVACLLDQLGGEAEIDRRFLESFDGTITREDSPHGTITLRLVKA